MKNTQLEKLLAEYNELSTGLKAILSSYKRKRKIRLSMRWLFGGIATCCALIMIFLLLERTPVQSEGIRYAISFILYFCFYKKHKNVNIFVQNTSFLKKIYLCGEREAKVSSQRGDKLISVVLEQGSDTSVWSEYPNCHD